MNNWIIIIALMSAGLLLMVAAVVVLLRLSKMKDTELRNSGKMELKVQALKIIMNVFCSILSVYSCLNW